MLKKFTNKKGFTLMEMLIVVAIIGHCHSHLQRRFDQVQGSG